MSTLYHHLVLESAYFVCMVRHELLVMSFAMEYGLVHEGEGKMMI
jgi:hypothetical protein